MKNQEKAKNHASERGGMVVENVFKKILSFRRSCSFRVSREWPKGV